MDVNCKLSVQGGGGAQPPGNNCSCGPEGAVLNLKVLDLCRSYLTPVRDEEAEAQRKARSRHARQSRRSTQVQTVSAHMFTACSQSAVCM